MTAGGGTRTESHGRASTRLALSTRALAAIEATHPAAAAAHAHPADAAPTTTMPATRASVISGTANRLRTRPAAVTRENADALIGNRTTSTANDATTVAGGNEKAAFRGSLGG